ncbi:MAG: rhodanese-related sulfurtransferase [Siphonobacter sp.]
MKAYRILLYYLYTPIENTLAYREEHHRFCLENNLLGRIIISEEGLNGTVSGLEEDCQRYMDWLHADARFAAIQFKIDEHDGHVFHKLHVRVKDEIVNSDLPVNPLKETGIHLEPKEFHEMIQNDPDVVLIDMRSNYEHNVGKFKGAITFDMENLRELPDHIAEIEHLKNSGKKLITYCTGGIKCEKASAYLLHRGFENVYQLHGGIIRYGIEEGGENFDGDCYVFDGRVTTPVNRINPEVISKCHHCGTPTSRMINCANNECNEHIPMCENCGWEMEGCCSNACKSHPQKRVYNGTGYYPKRSESYSPKQGYISAKGSFRL